MLLGVDPAVAFQALGAWGRNLAVAKQTTGHHASQASATMQQKLDDEVELPPFLKALQKKAKIFVDSMAAGSTGNQAAANAQAGEYNPDETRAELNQIIATEPAVMFTWSG